MAASGSDATTVVLPRHDRRAADRAPNGHGAATIVAERRSWGSGGGSSVIACVDVQPSPRAGAPQSGDLLWRLALRRMERCIRPGDRLCLLGGPRVAVVLGNGSHRVAPSALGRRLARAMGDHLAVGATALDLHVAIGIGASTAEVEPATLAAAAMASLRHTRRHVGATAGTSPATLVAVTHVPDNQAVAPGRGAPRGRFNGTEPCQRTGREPRRLDRRVVVALDDEGPFGASPAVNGHHATGGVEGPIEGAPALRVLLVDPDAAPAAGPRPVMEAVATVARRLGSRPVLSSGADLDALLLDFYLSKPDVAVVVLQPETFRHGAGHPVTDAWDHAARITRALRDAGTPVIALSVGASAAALAVCVEQGAVGLLHSDLLSPELARQATRRVTGNGSTSANGYDELRGPGQLPAPYDTLVHLTPSERRVLFHMMEGRSAAEIATTLVVSLTTVRSHIRSILRKLNVNSQLAAVALAFGTLPDQFGAE